MGEGIPVGMVEVTGAVQSPIYGYLLPATWLGCLGFGHEGFSVCAAKLGYWPTVSHHSDKRVSC